MSRDSFEPLGDRVDDQPGDPTVAESADAEFDGDAEASVDATHADVSATDASVEEEQAWWDDPGMPWKSKPTRADLACMGWIFFLGVFSMAMIPLRAWLLGAPERLPWMVALLGSRSGTAALGSVVRVGTELPFVWPLLVGALMSIKLDWVYWWAGKLWGRGMIEIWAGQSERTQRTYARAERWAQKLGWLGILVSYVPIPLPIMPVVFVLSGAHGMRLRTFLSLDFVASLVWLLGYFLFGYAVGQPAVALLNYYAKFANWVAIGLVVVIVAVTMIRSYREASAEEK